MLRPRCWKNQTNLHAVDLRSHQIKNPAFTAVISDPIDNFKKYELDAIFIFTNAPERYDVNKVKRLIAPPG